MSDNHFVASSAMILAANLALIAASITFWVTNVLRRRLADEMLQIAQDGAAGPVGAH